MRLVDDRAELATIFGRRRDVHAYGLADLEGDYWAGGRWFLDGEATVGLVPLGPGQWTVYAITAADERGTLRLVVDVLDEIPDGTMITGPVGLADAVAAVAPIDDLGLHVKCVLEPGGHWPDTTAVVPIDPADFPRLEALHATAPGDAFVVASMLDDGGFVGVEHPDEPGRLVAAAGTHTLSDTHRIAAVGAVLVEPAWRGRGLGAVVTAGVIERIGDRVDTIRLNVEAENIAARRTYARLGFVDVLTYEEIILRPR